MTCSLRELWDGVAPDPAPEDLGYESDSLTVIFVHEDGDGYMFLPTEEDHQSDAEFLIATPESVCRLEDRR